MVDSLINVCIRVCGNNLKSAYKKYLPVPIITNILPCCEKSDIVLAAKNGHLACLKYARENGCTLTIKAPEAAAENGHLDCLVYMMPYFNGSLSNSKLYKTLAAAVGNGHFECLVYLWTNCWIKNSWTYVGCYNTKSCGV